MTKRKLRNKTNPIPLSDAEWERVQIGLKMRKDGKSWAEVIEAMNKLK
jgi:hypothetical protein